MQQISKATLGNIDYFTTEGSTYPFSTAIQINGPTVYLSGQIGIGIDGKLKDTLEEQSLQMMINVANTLAGLGLGIQDLVKCTIYLKDIERWGEFNAVYLTFFPDGVYPARTAIGVANLVFGAEVEIECIAASRKNFI